MYTCFLQLLCVAMVITAQDYHQVALDTHNRYRPIHHVTPYTLSDDLSSRAMQCAAYYVERDVLDHSCPYKNGAGEGIWAHWPGNVEPIVAAEWSTNTFYEEEVKHDYDLDYQPATGHFTQVVWKSSRDMGVGWGRNGTLFVWVTLYYPHGNVIGMFRENVLRP